MALGLYAVLQAVDGVALKQAVNAWVSAPEADQPARYAAAETVRWLEWGTRSYHSYTLGLALILLGSADVFLDFAIQDRVRLANIVGSRGGLSVP